MKWMGHSNRAMLPAVLLLAACGSGAEQPAANQAEPSGSPAPASTQDAHVPPLAGQWTVTAINGKPLDQLWPMHANVNEVRFQIESDCVRIAYEYVQDRNIVRFTPQPTESCDRVRSPAELQIERPIELANIAMFSQQGSEAQLSGPGGNVTMVRR